jgi:hypothetical protein
MVPQPVRLFSRVTILVYLIGVGSGVFGTGFDFQWLGCCFVCYRGRDCLVICLCIPCICYDAFVC